MPFTAAHPAFVLPFLHRSKRWFSSTALIIGSMAPDSEYFLRLQKRSEISHSSIGILEFDLPLTLLLALLYHGLVRDQLIQHLPPYFRRRALAVTYQANYFTYLRRHWLAFLVSAIIGGFSHLLWDSFTFDRGFIVEHVPLLEHVVSVAGMKMQLCRLIQHLSSVVGILLILLYVHRQPTTTLADAPHPWLAFWLIISLGGLLFMFYHIMMLHHVELATLVIAILSGCLLAMLFASLFYTLKQSILHQKE
ncbi:DUF4184 family protein [Pontibacter chitinilyticus]|uniref:DUF4184 family protein n=1 Tax=Pontibacter chitinilyticus TaxID=2674989 RepID=UPI00321ABC76